MEVRVRFAPSPTGNPHVGNIRAALFTLLFARQSGGKFLLRIEDTDKDREVKQGDQVIFDSLRWLDLNWDGEVIYQSKRLDIYQEHAQKLIGLNKAYHQKGATYFKTDKEGETAWIDLVGGKKISFENSTQDDFVILKSDGFPTYHLASVVDDHLMEITHVTRGEDWVSSTPKHIMLYRSFGWEVPQFVHFPNILAPDRSKLSKRHASTGVLDFKKDGFLPQALINFLALLGWTPPSGKEILTLSEMTQEFDLKDVNTTPAIFDLTKLAWMNGEYIRMMPDEKLLEELENFLVDHPAKDELVTLIPLVKERIKKLSDFIPLTQFLFEDVEYEKEVFDKLKIENIKEVLSKILEKLEAMGNDWQAEEFEKTFRNLAEDLNLSASQMFQLIRVAVSGQTVTPPLFECIKILGEEETVSRVKKANLLLSTPV